MSVLNKKFLPGQEGELGCIKEEVGCKINIDKCLFLFADLLIQNPTKDVALGLEYVLNVIKDILESP